jgi:ATP-dependent DNA helicase RecQ
MSGIHDRAHKALAEVFGPSAAFRDQQLDAIESVVGDRARTLVVQRTGWGKSVVYFIATRLLRDEGAGTTLIVSPLLALMRDQISMAERLGLRAETINSSNNQEWDRIENELLAGQIDILLISPERLNNPDFRERLLEPLASRAGLLVIDEAHCISDWGHDFRPDYRRISRLLELLPANVPCVRRPQPTTG